jgi:flap endonuclease-1
MGIRHLNKYLRENAKKSIKIVHLSELAGKKIAIDISIYMYKYASENTLIENIYLMLTIFRYYNIIPVFIFDGKPPVEKKELLLKRKEEKIEAKKEFDNLKKQLESNNVDENEKQEIIQTMDSLKKNFVSISKNDIENVKTLIRAYGATYYDAHQEADELCAMLSIKEKVWGCLSEDMDMFIYGCPRVLRYLSLLNHTFVLYDTKKILNKLEMNQYDLSEICVISGTDYNFSNKQREYNLFTTLKYFNKYKKINKNAEIKKEYYGFYNWLLENTNYLESYNNELYKINYSMFCFNDYDYLKEFENIKIANKNKIISDVKELLKRNGFIFV